MLLQAIPPYGREVHDTDANRGKRGFIPHQFSNDIPLQTDSG